MVRRLGQSMKLLEKLKITPGPWEWEGWAEFDGAKRLVSSESVILDGADYYPGYPECGEDIRINCDNNQDSKLIAAAPQLFTDEVDNKEDAHKAMIELEKEFPDLHRVFNLLGNIVARSANGAEKATGKSWQEIQQVMEE